jgi:hypothetical protein
MHAVCLCHHRIRTWRSPDSARNGRVGSELGNQDNGAVGWGRGAADRAMGGGPGIRAYSGLVPYRNAVRAPVGRQQRDSEGTHGAACTRMGSRPCDTSQVGLMERSSRQNPDAPGTATGLAKSAVGDLTPEARKLRRWTTDLLDYLRTNRDSLPNYGERNARESRSRRDGWNRRSMRSLPNEWPRPSR